MGGAGWEGPWEAGRRKHGDVGRSAARHHSSPLSLVLLESSRKGKAIVTAMRSKYIYVLARMLE